MNTADGLLTPSPATDPAAAIPAGPADTVVELGTRPAPTRRAPARREACLAAVHRGFGTWTHVYTTTPCPQGGRREVRLLLVLEGERLAEAAARIAASPGFAASVPPEARAVAPEARAVAPAMAAE